MHKTILQHIVCATYVKTILGVFGIETTLLGLPDTLTHAHKYTHDDSLLLLLLLASMKRRNSWDSWTAQQCFWINMCDVFNCFSSLSFINNFCFPHIIIITKDAASLFNIFFPSLTLSLNSFSGVFFQIFFCSRGICNKLLDDAFRCYS